MVGNSERFKQMSLDDKYNRSPFPSKPIDQVQLAELIHALTAPSTESRDLFLANKAEALENVHLTRNQVAELIDQVLAFLKNDLSRLETLGKNEIDRLMDIITKTIHLSMKVFDLPGQQLQQMPKNFTTLAETFSDVRTRRLRIELASEITK